MYDFPLTKNLKTGGSTLTVNIKFVSNGRMVSATTNAGDSTFSVFKKIILKKIRYHLTVTQ